MLRKHAFWLRTALVFQLLTGLIHAMSFFSKPQPENETEAQLVRLTTEYRMDMGAGYQRTLHELFTSVSITFSLLFLFGGILNAYLIRKKVEPGILRGLVWIQVFVFGACLAAMMVFAFLPPIVLCALVFGSLAAAALCLSGARPRKAV